MQARSPLLRLQSDERLIHLTRRGSQPAFEVLVGRYQTRLLAFCRHLLGSREDAEDVLQEVFAAAFNAMLADERTINVRPWLYRIARNRSLNHLRRASAIGVDSMDVHFSDNGASTADKVHDREHFRLLVGDIQQLPETQRTALILREMDALSYDQIAEAMETTVPSVKSLLVRARVSLAEAAEARQLTCAEVRIELAEVAEGLRRRPEAPVRRHLRSCRRCSIFHGQLKKTNRALAALLPLGPLALLKKLVLVHLGGSAFGGSAGTGSGATATAGAAGAGAGGATATAGAGTVGASASAGAAGAGVSAGAAGAASAGIGVSSAGVVSAGATALAGKAAAGLAAAIVTVGAVEASHSVRHQRGPLGVVVAHTRAASTATDLEKSNVLRDRSTWDAKHKHMLKLKAKAKKDAASAGKKLDPAATTKGPTKAPADPKTTSAGTHKSAEAGRTQSQTDPTVLSPGGPGTGSGGPGTGSGSSATSSTTTSPTSTAPSSSPDTTSSGSGSTDTTSTSSTTPTSTTTTAGAGGTDTTSTTTTSTTTSTTSTTSSGTSPGSGGATPDPTAIS